LKLARSKNLNIEELETLDYDEQDLETDFVDSQSEWKEKKRYLLAVNQRLQSLQKWKQELRF